MNTGTMPSLEWECATSTGGTLYSQTPSGPAILKELQTKTMIALPNPVMEINYKESYSQETVDKIEELIAETYCLEDIVEFIEANSEEDFRNLYEEYVNVGDEYSYGAVDAFIEEFGLHSFTSSGFEDAYRGQWESKEQYAENYVSDCYSVDLPGFIEIDWEATFDNLDVTITFDGYVFDTQF
jgi:hypothetical protein